MNRYQVKRKAEVRRKASVLPTSYFRRCCICGKPIGQQRPWNTKDFGLPGPKRATHYFCMVEQYEKCGNSVAALGEKVRKLPQRSYLEPDTRKRFIHEDRGGEILRIDGSDARED